MDISLWWEGLGALERVYWAIALPSSLIFLIQLAMTMLGADGLFESLDADFDTDTDFDDAGGGWHFFTFKNLIAFFTIFGWTGIACLDSGFGAVLSTAIASASGLLMMSLMATLFYALTKADESGTLLMENAIGTTGEVYMTIQGRRSNIGKVQVKVQGSLRTLEAMTDQLEDLRQGTVVEVTDVVNDDILIVSKNSKNLNNPL